MADRDETSMGRPLRPAVPRYDGPLASSGAAPDPTAEPAPPIVPRPRSEAEPASTAADASVAGPEPASGPTPATETTPATGGSTTAGTVATAGGTVVSIPAQRDPETSAPASGGDEPAEPAASTEAAPQVRPASLTTTTEPVTPTESTKATDPATPTEPVTPTEPTKATDGATPTEPVTPTDSTKATGPTKATDPTAPTESAKPADPTRPTGSTRPAVPGGPAETVIDLDVPAVGRTGRNRRIRVRFAHAVNRWPSPGAAAVAGAQAVGAWSRRPSGRLTLPALLLFALVAATGAAGAFLIPATARAPRLVDAGASSSIPPPEPTGIGFPADPGALPPSGLPNTPSPGAPTPPVPPWNAVGGRPSDVLAGWAAQVGNRLGISPTAMQAYGYAELRLGQSTPGCQLRWTTLAAIGHVESSHGRANGAVLGANGVSTPEIIGLPLDGNGNRMRIMDTEDGRLDRDATYDRAVGPMQFIPTTWELYGADADGDGVKNPHSLDDAALAAGNYLCKGGRNLSVASDWWNAILSYNDVRPYAQSVFDTANKYGTDSKT